MGSSGGDTALHLCTLHGNREVVRRLLLANAAANAIGGRKWTPLHVAASRGHAATVSEILAHGGDVAARNDEGHTPGDLARKLSDVAQPHLGKSLTGQQEVALVLMQAERLRANQDCGLDQICPQPVPGGVHIYSPGMTYTEDAPAVIGETENVTSVSIGLMMAANISNVSNGTTQDTSSQTDGHAGAGDRDGNHTNVSNSTSTPTPTTTTTTTTTTTSITTTTNTTTLLSSESNGSNATTQSSNDSESGG